MPDNCISIITCAYNPPEDIFTRVLKSVSQLDKSGIEMEYCIVDNNSNIPLTDLKYVQDFLEHHPWARVIVEKEPGLTAARICGVNNTKYGIVLFVDDDVEPDKNYLQSIVKLFQQAPSVGAWNAGKIEAEYLVKPSKWFLTKGKIYFQQSDIAENIWGNDKTRMDYIPFGTGLCIRREALNLYQDKVKNKEYSLTDRIGNKTVSCGDSQIVFCAMDLNYNVGRSPLMKLTHLVSPKKATIDYLCRLNFGLGYSFQFFKRESTPEVYRPMNRGITFLKILVYNTIHLIPHFDFRSYRISLTATIGSCLADFRIQKKSIPPWLKFFLFLFTIKYADY